VKAVTSKTIWAGKIDIYKLVNEFKQLGFDLDGRVCDDGIVELVIKKSRFR